MRRRSWTTALIAAVVVGALTTGCVSTPSGESVREQIAGIASKNLASYRFDSRTPIVDRVEIAPAFLIEDLRKYDNNYTYTAYEPTPEEHSLLEQSLALLPPSYMKLFEERLVGIFFVNRFIGSGMTDYVIDGNQKLYFTLILNPETMRHDASDWLSHRESTCFGAAAGEEQVTTVKIDCGREYTGLLYVLLHEGAHMIDYLDHATPYVDWSMQVLGMGTAPTSFSAPVWRSYSKPRARDDFPLRSELHFYGLGKPIPISQAAALYRGLKKSPFVSLYGSTNWAEDFAEYMTWYWWTQNLHQPYTIELNRDGSPIWNYAPMSEARILDRAKLILPLLG